MQKRSFREPIKTAAQWTSLTKCLLVLGLCIEATLHGALALTVTPNHEQAALPQHSADPNLYHNRVTRLSNKAWINQIGARLSDDDDLDGFFSTFALSIDADSHDSHLEVYVTISLQHQAGKREKLYTSQVYSLYQQSQIDSLQIEIELLTEYQPEHYNLFVDVFNADDNRLLDGVSGNEFTNLALLPLESREYDSGNFISSQHPPPIEPPTVRITAEAGSAGILLPGLLTWIVWVRRKTQT